MKYLKKYESPDRLEIDNKFLTYNTYNARPFGIIKDKFKMNDKKFTRGEVKDNFVLGREYSIHPLISLDLFGDSWDQIPYKYFDYAGRLWSEDKVISFWEYPESKEELQRVIDHINTMSYFKIDDTWRIEIVVGGWNPDDNADKKSEVINIKDYVNSLNPSEEEFIMHNLNWKQKENLKKQGKLKTGGFGSTKSAKDMPIEWRDALGKFRGENLSFDEFILETKSNMKSFEYQAIKYNTQKNPILYVVDYEIVKDDGERVECKIKGYQYTDIQIDEDNVRKGWVKVNDFTADKRTHILHKKDFKPGKARRKIYDIIT